LLYKNNNEEDYGKIASTTLTNDCSKNLEAI